MSRKQRNSREDKQNLNLVSSQWPMWWASDKINKGEKAPKTILNWKGIPKLQI